MQTIFQDLAGTKDLAGIIGPVVSAIESHASLTDFLALLETAKPEVAKTLAAVLGNETAGQAVALKVLNLLLAKYHYLQRSVNVLSRPLGLVVDPINNCNLACPGCVHSARSRAGKLFDWNSGMLSEACFSELLKRFGPWALEIMMCNYGEPLLNPKTPRFIEIARGYMMRTGLSTNMTAKRFDAGAYVDSGLDFMTISIDGATQATYERYRRDGDIEVAFANIRSLAGAKKERGRENPILSWQFLAFEHNVHEIDAAIALARELGVDQFVIASPFDVSWDDPSIHPAVSVEPRTVSFRDDMERRMIANFNPVPDEAAAAQIRLAWQQAFERDPAHLSGASSPHTCQWLYRNMVMDANGRVLPCCAAPKPDFDLVFDHFNGNKPGDSFNSPAYKAARQHFADPSVRGLEPYCVRCEWNQDTAHTDGEQADQYWKTLPGNAVCPDVRKLLHWK